MTVLAVLACGPATSIQDGGRIGWQRYGVSASGAMDRLALALANALVGNEPDAAAIELQWLGGRFAVESGSARLAFAGAEMQLRLDGAPVGAATSLTLRPGQRLDILPARAGVYGYLSVAGGFDIAPELGSLSLQSRARLGGFDGRGLAAGDHLPLRRAEAPGGPERRLADRLLDDAPEQPIRVVPGPQDDQFTAAGLATFFNDAFVVSAEADRMGMKLAGPPIEHADGFNIVSDGIVAGSVQVPGSGVPIVMLADCQTTGGYPKIATVISADLRRLAQRRPGDAVRFEPIGVGAAEKLARERSALIRALPTRLEPARAGGIDPAALHGETLAGRAIHATDEATWHPL